MQNKIYTLALIGLLCLCLPNETNAQLTVSGQIRTRTELRDGQGTPNVDTIPALFTSQRSRLNVGYAGYRFKFYTSIQDVRVWGQDGSSINRFTLDGNDGFMLHEAWAEISLVDTGKVVKNFALKIGRQEFVYDDVRLLGNLDWLQQARRHDAMLLKFDYKGWTAHLAAAFNQNAERKSNHIYTPTPGATYPVSTNGMATPYKSLQFVYVAKKLHFGNASFLAVKDDFSKFKYSDTDVNKTTPLWEKGVWSRFTVGGNLFGTAARKINFALSAFYQGGKYRNGTELSEYLLSASGLYSVGRKWSIGPGVDYTTGNDGTDATKSGQRFDPLYGTPHKFWGFMDYFYVADGFGQNGLIDYYLKARYKAKDNLSFMIDGHRFVLPDPVKASDNATVLEKSLGTEIDLVMNYNLTKAVGFEVGYSTIFTTETMTSPKVKPIKGKAEDQMNWAYVMINIKPSEFTIKP